MILYHGSTVEVQQPRILKSEIGRDFGFLRSIPPIFGRRLSVGPGAAP